MSTATKTAATAAATKTLNAATTTTATVRRRPLSGAGTGKKEAHRAAFGGTIRKPSGLRRDNKETERPAGGQKRNCERHAKKFRSVRGDNSETAKDMRRSFEAQKKEAKKRQ